MKCTKCNEEATSYYKKKRYCSRHYEQEKWWENHLTLEELKEIARKRVGRINEKKLSELRKVM